MMWQDGLALLIVVIAALAVLRTYAPAGMFRFGTRRDRDGLAKDTAVTGGCGGCASGSSSCSKLRIKAYPVAVQRRERSPSSSH
ncbi:MAG: hypothetical protein ABTR27_02220 [Candidatus Competibacter phosphatis]